MISQFLGLGLMALGTYSVAAAIINWEWFFQQPMSLQVQSYVGRRGARVFYVLLGLVLAIAGALLVAGVLEFRNTIDDLPR